MDTGTFDTGQWTNSLTRPNNIVSDVIMCLFSAPSEENQVFKNRGLQFQAELPRQIQ